MTEIPVFPYTEAAALALLHFLWQGAALALAAGIALRILRARSPEFRYWTACLFLLSMLLLPGVTCFLLLGETPAFVPSGSLEPFETPAFSGLVSETKPGRPWLSLVLALWLAGVSIFSLRAIGGWLLAAWRFSTRRSIVSADLRAKTAALSHRIGIRRAVRVFQSARVDVPCVFGVIRPVLMLPASLLSGLPPSHVEAVLAHELAHIRRFDHIVNCLQAAVEVLLFYHPAVWWLSARIRQERETCCGAIAVGICGDRMLYSRALLRLEERRQAFTIAATAGNLKSRIERLFQPGAERKFHPAPAAFAMGLLLILLATPVAVIAMLAPVGQGSSFPRAAEALRDPDPSTPVNEAVEEHARRIRHANRHFSGSRPGSETARGRVYIENGPPHEMEVTIYREIWRYPNGHTFEFAGPDHELQREYTSRLQHPPPVLERVLLDRLSEPARSQLRKRLAPFQGQPFTEGSRRSLTIAAGEIDPVMTYSWRSDPATGNVTLELSHEEPAFDGNPHPSFAATGERRIRIGSRAMRSKLAYSPRPDNPASETGAVRLAVLIGTDGRVRDLYVLRGSPRPAAAAEKAVRTWQYQPTYLDGIPVEVATIVDFPFEALR